MDRTTSRPTCYHDKDLGVGGSALEWSFWPLNIDKFCSKSGRFIAPLYVVRAEEHRSPEFPAFHAFRRYGAPCAVCDT